MKKKKLVTTCYMVSSICFYLCFIIELFSKDLTQAFLDLTLASSFLCFYFSYKKK